MTPSDWTRDSEGNVQYFPVAAWEIVPTNDRTTGLIDSNTARNRASKSALRFN
jgi:hypothetical protein